MGYIEDKIEEHISELKDKALQTELLKRDFQQKFKTLEDMPAEKIKECEMRGYLNALEKIGGAKRALKFFRAWKPKQLIEMDNLLDGLDFPYVPKTRGARLDLINEAYMVDGLTGGLLKEIKDKSSKNYLIPLSVDDIYTIHDVSLHMKQELKDVGLSNAPNFVIVTTKELLIKYGTDADKDGLEEYLIHTSDGPILPVSGRFYQDKFKVLPAVPMDALAKLILRSLIDSTRKYRSDFNINEGFDSWSTALEYAKVKKPQQLGWSEVPHVNMGLNKIEHVKNIKIGAIQQVYRQFGKGFSRDYVQGDIEKFQELLNKAQMKDAKIYFNVLKEDLDAFDAMVALENTPSGMAVQYVNDYFKPQTFDALVEQAQKIDGEFSEEDAAYLFTKMDAKDADEFVTNRDRYLEGKKAWMQTSGSDGSGYTLNFQKQLDDNTDMDMNYLLFIMGDRLVFNPSKAIARVKQLQKVFDLEEYKKLFPSSASKAEDICFLMKQEYSKAEIVQLSEGGASLYRLKELIKDENKKMPLDQLKVLSNLTRGGHGVNIEKAAILSYFERGIVGGDDGLPVELLNVFYKQHQIRASSLKKFKDVVGFDKYTKDTDGNLTGRIDVPMLIRDYRTFMNQDQPKEKQENRF